MLDAFRQHLESSGLIPPGCRVLVGFSGGPDSACLVDLLHKCGIDVVAAHLHHGQRPEAEQELDLCQAFAEARDIGFMAGRADVPKMAEDLKIGLEEAGRLARYQFFRSAAQQAECSLIATAHTLDDQAETVLFNLTRGSGRSGLGGIPETRENIIRPLLPFSRQETQAYCRDNSIETHDDPANQDPTFSRTRIRLNVIPELEKINPAVRKAIQRASSIIKEEDQILDGLAARMLESAEVPLNGELEFVSKDCEVRFQADFLRHHPLALVRRGLHLAAQTMGGTTTAEQLEIAARGVLSGSKGSVTSENGAVNIAWSPELIDVFQSEPDRPFRFPLTLPGETVSDEFRWKITAESVLEENPELDRGPLAAVLDHGSLKGPLYFRSVETGDRIQPLGLDGTRLLSDVLGERKLTRSARARLPVICDLIGPIWIPGGPISERAKVTGQTTRLLGIKFEPI